MEKLSAIQQIWGNFEAFQNMSFPLDARTLSDIQANTALSMAIGNIGGDRYYLVEPSAQTNWCGFAFLSTNKFPCGELLYIDGVNANGGILPNQLCLIEEPVNVMGVSGYDYPNAYTRRKLVHGLNLGVQQFERNSFQPIKTNLALKKEVDDLTKKVKEFSPEAVGSIKMWASQNIPANWRICDGSSLDRTEYAELFAIIGTQFGGSGSSFNLPNMQGKSVFGYIEKDQDFGAMDNGNRGERAHELLESEIPEHTHTFYAPYIKDNSGNTNEEMNKIFPDDTDISNFKCGGGTTNTSAVSRKTTAFGGVSSHNNLPPYITLNFIIKAK